MSNEFPHITRFVSRLILEGVTEADIEFACSHPAVARHLVSELQGIRDEYEAANEEVRERLLSDLPKPLEGHVHQASRGKRVHAIRVAVAVEEAFSREACAQLGFSSSARSRLLNACRSQGVHFMSELAKRRGELTNWVNIGRTAIALADRMLLRYKQAEGT